MFVFNIFVTYPERGIRCGDHEGRARGAVRGTKHERSSRGTSPHAPSPTEQSCRLGYNESRRRTAREETGFVSLIKLMGGGEERAVLETPAIERLSDERRRLLVLRLKTVGINTRDESRATIQKGR